ncbi:hypothetical protein C6500_06000 [Candidatus Poribacteria bacterium]|nr:MAG: hypothetical protein C6500_06000 [Candidatus Poribacteria bacterium]
MPIDSTPFEKLRARALVGYAVLTFITTFIIVAIFFRNGHDPYPEAAEGILLYLLFSLFTLRMLSRVDLSYSRLFGIFPTWCTLGQYNLWIVPLVIVSIASIYLLFFPLSFLFPEFVKTWFIEFSPPMIWTGGDNHIPANVLNFLTIVIVAPVLEEFFFRGILLTRWTVKWSIIPAVIVSSGVFALLHTNLIGSFCFGCVMAVFYIRTKSLFIPISVHIANNGIAWIMEFLTIQFDNLSTPQTIAGFQESWWIGLVGLIVSIPCVIYFWKRYMLKIDWRVPYLSESTDCENDTTG